MCWHLICFNSHNNLTSWYCCSPCFSDEETEAEINFLRQGHMISKWQSWDSLRPMLLIVFYYSLVPPGVLSTIAM